MRKFALLAWATLWLAAAPAFGNHGPGTSGGGSATVSGETLQAGKFDFSLRMDYTNFEDVSQAGAERRALRAGGFDAIQESYIYSLGASYGITDDFQIAANIGYYKGNGFVDAEAEDGVADSSTANPDGITDLTLQFKYRVLSGKPGNLSVLAGVIAPTGRHNARLVNGESLEPSSQPGTGAWGYQIGVAYSRFLTSKLTIDGSGVYTIRTQHEGFEVGDRLDLGIAVAYRMTDSIKAFPNFSVFGEVNAVWLGKDTSDDITNPNSGGWTTYLTPGGRVRFSEFVSMTVAPSFPISQEQNGVQVESRFKLAVTLSFSFEQTSTHSNGNLKADGGWLQPGNAELQLGSYSKSSWNSAFPGEVVNTLALWQERIESPYASAFILFFAVLSMSLALAGCSTSAAPANDGQVHAECKVCKHNADMACIDVVVEKQTPHAEYNGKTYYFCSDHCCKKFQQDPAKYAAE